MRMKFSEMLKVMFESAQLVNQRPIGRHPGSPDELYLCPNDLLLGRASPEVPQKSFADMASLKSCFFFVRHVINCFLEKVD